MLSHFLPLLVILGVLLAFPSGWRQRWRSVPLIDACLVAGLAVLVARYLWWRLTVTVWPVEGFNAQSVFVWTLFLVEMLSWVDAGILFMALLRRTDRSAEADRAEARLRARTPRDLPHVDVFIATYNEPEEVLEKTVIGALSLDWPADRLRVYVLDDGRRSWLRAFCERTGAIHMTRSDNAHAKAGNINAAIRRTDAPFFLVLDADFVPQRSFLYRAMGFFDDPKIGIVQIPHNFFNGDPMQSNLGIRQTLPDDQRFFFDAIMPGRDGWDCAFCCGSNALTRRSAMEAVGGGLPTGSITEDMLLTLALLRKGYVTRYLNERLAVGLAAESLSAFFVQRARWAQGAIQILYLREGPLGPGLTWFQRLLFLPTHWITQSLCQIAAMMTPAIYLWTGLMPLVGANFQTVISYQVPAILGTLAVLRLLAPGQFFPLAASAHGVLQAFRLLPTIALTLFKPHGHKFKVTPKGSDASDGSGADRFTVVLTIGLMLFTAVGLLLNANFNTRIIESIALVPIVAGWAIYNMVVLSIVATIAVSPPMLRGEERFDLDEPCRLHLRGGLWMGDLGDISLSGVQLRLAPQHPGVPPAVGDWLAVELARVGPIPALVRRVQGDRIAAQFAWTQDAPRTALVRRLYTESIDNSTHNDNGLVIALRLLGTVLRRQRSGATPSQPVGDPPAWLIEALRAEAAAPSGWTQHVLSTPAPGPTVRAG
jgi:cellulose synthase (UDP-forming)